LEEPCASSPGPPARCSPIVLCLDNGKTSWCGWGGNSVSGSGVQHTWSGTNDGY